MKKTKNKLNLNRLFRKRRGNLPRYTITLAGYYEDESKTCQTKDDLNALPLSRMTIAVVKIPEDKTIEIKEFWGDDEGDEITEAFDACIEQYSNARVIQLDRPVPLEKCPCTEKDCSGYLTNLVFTRDLKRMP